MMSTFGSSANSLYDPYASASSGAPTSFRNSAARSLLLELAAAVTV